jgi:hypothetical protein
MSIVRNAKPALSIVAHMAQPQDAQETVALAGQNRPGADNMVYDQHGPMGLSATGGAALRACKLDAVGRGPANDGASSGACWRHWGQVHR